MERTPVTAALHLSTTTIMMLTSAGRRGDAGLWKSLKPLCLPSDILLVFLAEEPMNCAKCGKEMPSGASVCPVCGAAILPGDPLRAARVGSATPRLSSSLWGILAGIGSLVCFAIVAFFGYLSTLRAYHSSSAEAAGYWFGRCLGAYLLPLIGVFLYYKIQRKKPTAARRVFVISVWALGISLLSFIGEFGGTKPLSPQEMKQHIGALAKEATGATPVSADKTKWDGALRMFFSDIKSFNENYEKEVAQLDNSALKDLYSAESFGSAENITQMLAQLHATLDLDEKYASMQPIFDKLKERVSAMDASDSEKQAFWVGFESSARKSLEPRETALAKERDWLQGSIGLYDFARSNEGGYSVRNGKLIFKKGGLADDFNEKMKSVTGLRSEFFKAQEAYHKSQNRALGEIGLQPGDLGAPPQK